MSGALANMLGMGVTVQLLDMFTSTSNTVAKSANTLAENVKNSANKANNAWNGMFVGGALVASGTSVINMVAGLGKQAIESSSQLEIFRNQFHVMIKDAQWAERVYRESVLFAAKTPFTIPEVVGAAKTLRAFGFEANQIGSELKIAGDWAAMFGERIEKTAEIMGRAMSGGYGRALVYMRGRGVNDKDIREMARTQGTYDQLFDAKGRTKTGYDGNLMVNAMNALLQQKYGGEMEKRMTTLPGMFSNLKDQMILLTSTMGDQFKPAIKKLLGGILQDLNGPQMTALGKAMGQGFDVLVRALSLVVVPLHKVVLYLGELSEKHPMFMKWAVVVAATAGALVFLTGTWLVWIAAAKLWEMSGIVGQFATARNAIMGFIAGPMLWLIAIAGVLYMAYKYNFGGMADLVNKWWNNIKIVFNAVTEGFGSIQNGVVTFSTETYDALEKAGITKWVIDMMAVIYRAYVFIRGAGQAFYHLGYAVMYAGGIIGWILTPIGKLIEWGLRLAGVTANAADSLYAETWEHWGYLIGWVVGLIVVGTGAIKAWTAAKLIWSAVVATSSVIGNIWAFSVMSMQVGLWTMITAMFPATAAVWAFTTALLANPITWIVIAVVALVAGIVILIVKWKEITAWFKGSPQWLQSLLMAMMPLVFIPMWIYNNWDKVKKFLAPLGAFFKGIWDDPLNWLWDKIAALTAFFIRSMVKMMQFLPDWMKPGSLKAFDGIDPDKIDGALIRNMASNSIDAMRAARLNGTGYVGAAVAGMTANEKLNVGWDKQKPMTTPQVLQVNLDGRVLARSVFKHQAEETASGRTY